MAVSQVGLAVRPAPLARTARRAEPGLLRRIYKHRADYLYVAPALLILLLVIAYPVYYTVYLSFFSTPPSLRWPTRSMSGSTITGGSWAATASTR
jgi:multiple sugar transport system permease protein